MILWGSLVTLLMPGPRYVNHPRAKQLPLDWGCVAAWWGYSRVVRRQQEVEQQAYGLLHADLVSGGHALVQLVEDGGQYCFQPSHSELRVEVHGVEAVLSESLDHIPDVHQMDCRPNMTSATTQLNATHRDICACCCATLTVAFLLNESEFASCPVRRQPYGVQILSP